MSSPASHREPIGVIGTGYVGLVTAAGFAALGSEVYCVDIDAEKIRGLEQGRIPIWEPGLADLIAEHRERLHFATDLGAALEHARLLFVAVGTPPTYSGDADLSAVHAVVDAMPASDRHALVMKSTVPVGTGQSIERLFADQEKGFRYVSCPEFLKEGSAVKDFLEPDRVVIGDDGGWAGDAVEALYAPLDAPIVRTDVQSAEMVKLASNAFLATKISFINEIANVCEETGADVVEVARGMGLDDRIGPKFLQAGIGFGGSCFAPDQTVLARVRGRARLVTFDALWKQMDGGQEEAVAGADLEVLSWVPGEAEPEYLPVSLLTRRPYAGDMVEVRTKMGRRVRTTADHPFIVGDGQDDDVLTLKAAAHLDTTDWVPLALGGPRGLRARADARGRGARRTRPGAARAPRDRRPLLGGAPPRHRPAPRHPADGHAAADRGVRGGDGPRGGDGRDRRERRVEPDELRDRRALLARRRPLLGRGPLLPRPQRIHWAFHPEREQHLVDEVVSFWQRHGIKVRTSRPRPHASSRSRRGSSRRGGGTCCGAGRTSYTQRIPDLAWEQTLERKRALLSGLWEGDGSWSLVNGGPSVILEWGTISDELAEGVARLLADVGLVCSLAPWPDGQVDQGDALARASAAPTRSSGRCSSCPSAIAPAWRPRSPGRRSGSRPPATAASSDGTPWVRVVDVRRERYDGPVYSLEVPGSHTVVGNNGISLHNAFPRM